VVQDAFLELFSISNQPSVFRWAEWIRIDQPVGSESPSAGDDVEGQLARQEVLALLGKSWPIIREMVHTQRFADGCGNVHQRVELSTEPSTFPIEVFTPQAAVDVIQEWTEDGRLMVGGQEKSPTVDGYGFIAIPGFQHPQVLPQGLHVLRVTILNQKEQA